MASFMDILNNIKAGAQTSGKVAATLGKSGAAVGSAGFSTLIPGMDPDDDDERTPETHPVHAAVAAQMGRPVGSGAVHRIAKQPSIRSAFIEMLRRPGVQDSLVKVHEKVIEQKRMGDSGNLYGELQSYGVDVLIRGTFTAAAGLWGTDVPAGNNATVLQPGLALIWNFTALSGDYDGAWITEILYNTKPWSIPRGSQQDLGSFSWRTNNRFVPKPCNVSPGANLFISGEATAAANTYIWEAIGVPEAQLDGMDSKLIRYLKSRSSELLSLRHNQLANL